MSKTMADHARAYRKRRADKIARYEEALREIAETGPVMSVAQDIARNALNLANGE